MVFTSVYNVDDKLANSNGKVVFDTDAEFFVCDNSANSLRNGDTSRVYRRSLICSGITASRHGDAGCSPNPNRDITNTSHPVLVHLLRDQEMKLDWHCRCLVRRIPSHLLRNNGNDDD